MGNFINFLYALAFYGMIFGPSAAAIIWFIISFVMYRRTDKNSPKRFKRRILAVVSGCIAGVLTLATALLVGLFFLAMAHM